MKYQEITKKDEKALRDLIKENQELLRKARFDTTGAEQKDVRVAKKVIARSLTALTAEATKDTNQGS